VAARAGAAGDHRPHAFFQGLREGLIAFAEHAIRLDSRGPDGATERDHLLALWRATGSKPAALEPPPLAAEVAPLWPMYLEAAAARPAGLGVAPVPWAEFAAWARLRAVRLSPWAWGTLRALDMAAVSLLRQLAEKGKPGAKR
jgi:hypothetical protein